MSTSKLSERIRLVRKSQKLSQKKFAELLDVSRHSVINYENGTTIPELKFVMALCNQFSISSNWLLFGRTPYYTGDEKQGDLNIDFVQLVDGIEKKSVEELETAFYEASDTHPLHSFDTSAEMPNLVQVTTEKLTMDSPENYLNLLGHMQKDPEVRKKVFHFFHVFSRSKRQL